MNEEYMTSAEIKEKIAELKIRLAFQLEFEEELRQTLEECEKPDMHLNRLIEDGEEEILRKISLRKGERTEKMAGSRFGRKGFARAGKIIAIAAVLLTISFGSALAAIRMVEVGILKLDIRVQENGTIFRLVEAEAVPDGWMGSYYPSYIPEGFEFRAIDKFGVFYIDGEGNELSFDENMHGRWNDLDTENATISNVTLNGANAMVVEKDGWITVVWSVNNRYLVVEIQGNRETALRIAASVTLVK